MEQKIYTYEEAYNAALNYFEGDELAARVWVNKYAMKDSHGNIYEQSPVDMHWRLANEIARIEQKYPNPVSAQEVYDLLAHFRYIIPAGSPMTGIGNPYQVASLSNCFVIGVEGDADSYGAIMKEDEEQEQRNTGDDIRVQHRNIVQKRNSLLALTSHIVDTDSCNRSYDC